MALALGIVNKDGFIIGENVIDWLEISIIKQLQEETGIAKN